MDAVTHENGNNITNETNNERLLYTQFRKKINAEAAKSQIKKIEYNLCDVHAGVQLLKSACSDANALGMGGICVFPSYVRQCSAFLGVERETQLVACIGYPHGGDTTELKVKAVKRAIKDGADEVEVTAPISHIREGNYAYVKKEFKKLRSAAKRASLRIDAECSLLTKEEIIRVCSLAADLGVNSIKVSSGFYGGGRSVEMISAVKSAVKDRCTVKAEGATTVLDMSSAIDLGATIVGSKNAAEVARAILTAANDDF